MGQGIKDFRMGDNCHDRRLDTMYLTCAQRLWSHPIPPSISYDCLHVKRFSAEGNFKCYIWGITVPT